MEILNRFLVDLLRIARAVLLGRSKAALDAIDSVPVERLMLFEGVIGVGAGIADFSLHHAVTFPILMLGFTIIWTFSFCTTAGISEDRMKYYAIFFGSSTFLLPAVIPLIGPVLLVPLLIGWPFVICRLAAARRAQEPGRMLAHVFGPPLAAALLLSGALRLAGALSQFLTQSTGPVPR